MLQTLIQVLARSMNIGVRWSDSARTFSISKDPATGRMEVTLSRQAMSIKPGETAPLNTLLRGALAHEAAGHGEHTTFEDLLMDPPLLRSLHNILEDTRIESLVPNRFPGAKKILGEMAAELENRGFWCKTESPEQVICNFINRTLRTTILGQPLNVERTKDMEDRARALLGDNLADAILADARAGATSASTKDAGQAAQRILKMLQQSQPEQPQDQPDQGQSGQGPSDSKSQSQPEAESNPEAKPQGDSSSGSEDSDADADADSDSKDDGEGAGDDSGEAQGNDSSQGSGDQAGEDDASSGEDGSTGSDESPQDDSGDAHSGDQGDQADQDVQGDQGEGGGDESGDESSGSQPGQGGEGGSSQGSKPQAGKEEGGEAEDNAAGSNSQANGSATEPSREGESGEQVGGQGDEPKPNQFDGSTLDVSSVVASDIESALQEVLQQCVNRSFGNVSPIILAPKRMIGKPVNRLAHRVRESLRQHLHAVTEDEDDTVSDRGFLNGSMLAQIGAGLPVEHPFLETGREGRGLDTALFVLMDMSGSMNGIREETAEIMMAIGDATAEYASQGLSLGLGVFNNSMQVMIELGKPWRPSRGWVYDRYVPSGSTWWPPSAATVLPMLKASPRRRKILLTVTDGDIGGERGSSAETLGVMETAKHLGVEMAFLELTDPNYGNVIPDDAGFIVEHVEAHGADVAKAIGNVIRNCTDPKWL